MAAAIALLRAAAPEGEPQPLLTEIARDYEPLDLIRGFYYVSEGLIQQWVSSLTKTDRDAILRSMGEQTTCLDDSD